MKGTANKEQNKLANSSLDLKLELGRSPLAISGTIDAGRLLKSEQSAAPMLIVLIINRAVFTVSQGVN